MDQEDSINPFELLGVDHASCTPEDVRKAYRNLAFMCHPDKGGRAEDMRVLQTAYEWVTNQIAEVSERTKETYEQKEESFQAFLDAQADRKIPPFDTILVSGMGYTEELFEEIYDKCKTDDCMIRKTFAKQWVLCNMTLECKTKFYTNPDETYDVAALITRLVKEYCQQFQKQNTFHASIPHGYGDLLETSNGHDDDTTTPVAHSFGKMELIEYKEPNGIFAHQGLPTSSIERSDQMDDYTSGCMTDYCIAFKDTYQPLKELEDKYPTHPQPIDEQALLEYETQRKLEGTFIGTSKDIVALFKQFQQQIPQKRT